MLSRDGDTTGDNCNDFGCETSSKLKLLKELKMMGIMETRMKLYNSYLTGRYQRIKQKTCNSKTLFTTNGVPQGAVLGPLHLLICMTD